MVFASTEFIFWFLPLFLLCYFGIGALTKGKSKNLTLLIFSLIFYSWGEPVYVLLMVYSTCLDYTCGRMIEKGENTGNTRLKKIFLAVSLVGNLLPLTFFKYLDFLLINTNNLFSLSIPLLNLTMPIGISFYTFQTMSYSIDVYRGKVKAQHNIIAFGTYVTLFPQLIAGPIVRYETVAEEITGRTETADDFCEGIRRFMLGFSKKAILANTLARLVDAVYVLPEGEISVTLSWIAASAYLMQVYYDFSGYSDMAIGLGKMLGFEFLENFNYPYISKSITEFWRRWHISLGTWFRDYLFFPLGGSRVKSKWRLAFNMLVVWALTGLWHGAEWTYVCWGLLFFAVLIAEKLTGLGKWMEKHAVGHLYAMAAVVVITVLIRSSDISSALAFYKTMFGLNGAPLFDRLTLFMLKEYAWYLVPAVLCGLPVGRAIKNRLRLGDAAWELLSGASLALTTVLAVANVVAGGYNPFIYYNF